LREVAETTLQNAVYHHSKVVEWNKAITETILNHLKQLDKSSKYIVTVTILQKKTSVSGFHTSTSCLWDARTDYVCSYRWENRSMMCIINVYSVAY